MATSSLLGGSRLPEEISGKDVHALSPSDNSDSGSDAAGAYGDDELASDTDADILPDHIEQLAGIASVDELDALAGDQASDLREVEDLDASEGDAGDQGPRVRQCTQQNLPNFQ